MRRRGEVYRSMLFAALAACAFLAAAERAVDAKDAPLVAVGEVSANVIRPNVDVPEVLRAVVAEELPALDLSHARKRPVILSVSLVRMETEPTAHGATTTCVISAALRTKKEGNLFAILEGRANGEGADVSFAQEREVLRGAVHGALARIPEALAK